jgi:hypothetical protein
MEDDRSSFRVRDSLQCINDTGLLTGDLDGPLLHMVSQDQLPAASPPPDCQVVGDPSNPTLRIVVLGDCVPLAPGPNKCLLHEILRFEGIARNSRDLKD